MSYHFYYYDYTVLISDASRTKFALVGWVEEGSVGIMPLNAVKDGEINAYSGTKVPMKFQGKYYTAEILKILGKHVTDSFS